MTIDNAEPATNSLLARPGHSDLVADLYRAHAVTLIRIALLLVGDQQSAEDVVQEAFIGLQRGLPRLREPGKALPYLRACVLNGCRTVQRTRHRARLRPAQPAQPAPVWSAEAEVIAEQDRRAVLAAIAELPQRAREVLALRYYLDLPDAEIAAALKISKSTVSSTASRALTTLARKFEERS
jgi:RNA polymerase sigma factor (sigma-70 family)